MSDRAPGPIEWLTLPGRVLLIFTILACSGGFYWFFWCFVSNMPPGDYPAMFWLLPVLIGGCVFFVGAAYVLERAGIRIYRERQP